MSDSVDIERLKTVYAETASLAQTARLCGFRDRAKVATILRSAGVTIARPGARAGQMTPAKQALLERMAQRSAEVKREQLKERLAGMVKPISKGLAAGKSLRTIAAELRCCPKTLQKAAKLFGLTSQHARPSSAEILRRHSLIRTMVADGKSDGAIGAVLGIAGRTVQKIRVRLGIAPAARKRGSPRIVRPVPAARLARPVHSVEEYIREHGVTRCPPAYCAPVKGAEPMAEPVPNWEPAGWHWKQSGIRGRERRLGESRRQGG